MTMSRGMLLFDTPEPAIGDWENQLGYRGLKEVWVLKGTPIQIEIDNDDSYEGDEHDPDGEAGWEVSLSNEDTGDVQYLTFGTFGQCDEAAKKYMADNPHGPPK